MTAAIVTFDPSVHCEDVVLRFRAAPFSEEDWESRTEIRLLEDIQQGGIAVWC